MGYFANEMFADIANAEQRAAIHRDLTKSETAAIEAQKMRGYATAVVALKDVPLRKGNLPKDVAAEFDQGLLDAGLLQLDQKGKIKRGGRGKTFREKVPALINTFRRKKVSIPSQATVDAVLAIFEDLEITSESKIIAYTRAGREKYLSKNFPATVDGIVKTNFGKNAQGVPVPTSLKLGREVADRADKVGVDECEAELIAEIQARFAAYRKQLDMAADEANKNRDAADIMSEIFGEMFA